uniref:Serine, glycine, tyrosine and glutamine-rich protein-like n=2 Tax=Hirondellea gigas TaxID=1518452 RepID=A0A6A7FZ76_9CRUS
MRVHGCLSLLVLGVLVATSSASPLETGKNIEQHPVDDLKKIVTEEQETARQARDVQGGGGGHHGGGGGGHHGGGGSIAIHHDVSGGHATVGHVSNHIGGGGSSYSAPAIKPQPSYVAPTSTHYQTSSYVAPAPQKQTGYYYYYYPVQIQEDKKEKDGFMDKMKKLFKPMMYPWNAMMDYFGYGGDYDDYDYDYDTYGHYARSMVSRASDYIPWDSVNEIGNVVTQDQCVEFFVCQLGSYGREYRNLHILLDYLLPDVDSNSYTRSFKDSMIHKTDCLNTYSCPIVRRAPLITEDL